MTIPAILRAQQVICTVPGAGKAGAVAETVMGEVGEACPATAMRTATGCVLFCDSDSGAALL